MNERQAKGPRLGNLTPTFIESCFAQRGGVGGGSEGSWGFNSASTKSQRCAVFYRPAKKLESMLRTKKTCWTRVLLVAQVKDPSAVLLE